MKVTVSPAQQRFLDDQLKTGRYVDASEVVRDALRALEAQRAGVGGTAGGPSVGTGGDIETLMQIVMMEAARQADAEMKDMLAEMQARTAAKRAIRDVLVKMKRDRAANAGRAAGDTLDFSRGLGSEGAYHRVPMPQLDPDADGGITFVPADLHPGTLTTQHDLGAVIDSVQAALDHLSEMGEMESLRLQMMMDRRSKMMTTMSNVLKRISDTASEIAHNLK